MTKLKTTVELAGFDEGQVLSKPADQVKYLRELFNSTQEEGAPNTTLSDPQIVAIVVAQDGDEDNILEAMAMQDVPAPKPGQPIIAKTVTAAVKELEATELAKRADNNAELTEHLIRVSDSKQWLSFCAYLIMEDFKAQYTDEEMAKWPIIGAESHITDPDSVDKGKPTGHPNPDCYKRPTKRKGGGSSSAMDYWHKHFALGIKPIREMQEKITAAKNAGDKLSDKEKEKIENYWQPRINSAVAKVKQGIQLFQQLVRAEAYPAIRIDWELERVPVLDEKTGKPVLDKKGKPVFSHRVVECEKPLYIVDADPALNGKDFWQKSVQQFVGYDFAEAEANGGTVQALLDTATRETDDEAEGDGVAIITAEDVESASAGMLHWLNVPTNVKVLATELMTENDETNVRLQTLDGLYLKLGQMVGLYRDRLDKLEKAAEAAAKQDAA